MTTPVRPSESDSPIPNPQIEEILTALASEVVQGCHPYLLGDSRAYERVSRYRNRIAQRVSDPGAWVRDERNVRNAARQVGVIARSVVSVQSGGVTPREIEVPDHALDWGFHVVEEECALGNFGKQTGTYCGRETPSPAAPR